LVEATVINKIVSGVKVCGIHNGLQKFGNLVKGLSPTPKGQTTVFVPGKRGNEHRLYFVTPIDEEEKRQLEAAETLKSAVAHQMKIWRKH